MNPRPRKIGNRDLPSNLYSSKKKDRIYYEYKNPQTGKREAFGTNKQEAIEAAKQLNEIFAKPSNLVNKVVKTKNAFKNYLQYYRDDVIKNKRVKGFALSIRTIDEQKRIISHLIEELGYINIQKITQAQIANYLNNKSTAEVFNKHRSVLIMVFKQAISDGIIENNLPERILKRDQEAKKRAILTLDQYKLIYQHARPVIRNAMELSLNALQRRTDIQQWRFDCQKDGYFYITQSKTKKHGKAAYIRIPTALPAAYSSAGSATLSDIIKKCKDDSLCPFAIHEVPQKQRRSKEKQHPFQLSLKQLSDGFSHARNLAGITDKQPPTFHELLGLGQELRKKQGWSNKEIQTLRGHTSEKMTLHYMDDRDWTTIKIPSNL